MVNAREKLADVAFQNPESAGIVTARLPGKITKPIQRFVRALAYPARIGVGNKNFFEERIKHPVDGVMDEAVADSRFVDVPGLRVGDVKSFVSAVTICPIDKFIFKFYNIIRQSEREFLDVSLPSLPFHEFIPCLQKVFPARDFFKSMEQINFHQAKSSGSTVSSTPIMGHLVSIYKLWHEFTPNLPKTARYSLGIKTDSLFAEAIESIFSASYAMKEEKLAYLRQASSKIDLLKFFLQILWEIKALDNKRYLLFSEKLQEIGRMLGGWQRQVFRQENPAGKAGK